MNTHEEGLSFLKENLAPAHFDMFRDWMTSLSGGSSMSFRVYDEDGYASIVLAFTDGDEGLVIVKANSDSIVINNCSGYLGDADTSIIATEMSEAFLTLASDLEELKEDNWRNFERLEGIDAH